MLSSLNDDPPGSIGSGGGGGPGGTRRPSANTRADLLDVPSTSAARTHHHHHPSNSPTGSSVPSYGSSSPTSQQPSPAPGGHPPPTAAAAASSSSSFRRSQNGTVPTSERRGSWSIDVPMLEGDDARTVHQHHHRSRSIAHVGTYTSRRGGAVPPPPPAPQRHCGEGVHLVTGLNDVGGGGTDGYDDDGGSNVRHERIPPPPARRRRASETDIVLEADLLEEHEHGEREREQQEEGGFDGSTSSLPVVRAFLRRGESDVGCAGVGGGGGMNSSDRSLNSSTRDLYENARKNLFGVGGGGSAGGAQQSLTSSVAASTVATESTDGSGLSGSGHHRMEVPAWMRDRVNSNNRSSGVGVDTADLDADFDDPERRRLRRMSYHSAGSEHDIEAALADDDDEDYDHDGYDRQDGCGIDGMLLDYDSRDLDASGLQLWASTVSSRSLPVVTTKGGGARGASGRVGVGRLHVSAPASSAAAGNHRQKQNPSGGARQPSPRDRQNPPPSSGGGAFEEVEFYGKHHQNEGGDGNEASDSTLASSDYSSNGNNENDRHRHGPNSDGRAYASVAAFSSSFGLGRQRQPSKQQPPSKQRRSDGPNLLCPPNYAYARPHRLLGWCKAGTAIVLAVVFLSMGVSLLVPSVRGGGGGKASSPPPPPSSSSLEDVRLPVYIETNLADWTYFPVEEKEEEEEEEKAIEEKEEEEMAAAEEGTEQESDETTTTQSDPEDATVSDPEDKDKAADVDVDLLNRYTAVLSPSPPQGRQHPTTRKNNEDSNSSNSVNDVPLFWTVPLSGPTVTEEIFGACLGLVQASEMGISAGHDADPTLQTVDVHGQAYVNVDTTTSGGIVRAKGLGLVGSGLPDVVSTSLLHDAASTLFDGIHRGRVLTILRHPVDRVMATYQYLNRGKFVGPNEGDDQQGFDGLAGKTLEEYVTSDFADDNWMVRTLVNKPLPEERLTDTDLTLAKAILQRKAVIGLYTDLPEAIERFVRYFGWDLNRWLYGGGAGCATELIEEHYRREREGDDGGGFPEVPTDGEVYRKIVEKNEFDIQLYEYATELHKYQASQSVGR